MSGVVFFCCGFVSVLLCLASLVLAGGHAIKALHIHDDNLLNTILVKIIGVSFCLAMSSSYLYPMIRREQRGYTVRQRRDNALSAKPLSF